MNFRFSTIVLKRIYIASQFKTAFFDRLYLFEIKQDQGKCIEPHL